MSITEVQCDAGGVEIGSARRLLCVRRELASILSELDVAELGGAEAVSVTVALAEVERLAMAGKTLAAARTAETGHSRVVGFDTASKWLASVAQCTAAEASRTLETGRHLGDEALAPTRAALVAGALTASQAHEIATAAAKSPDSQARLLALAGRETVSRLRDECRAVRLASARPEDPDERAKRVKEEMAFGSRHLGGGMSEMYVRMPTSWLVRILAVVGSRCDEVFADARAQGREDPHHVYMVEALVTLLLFGGGDGAGADLYEELMAAIRGPAPPGAPRRKRRGRAGPGSGCRCGGRVMPRAKIVVRVDWAALVRGYAVEGELCDIAGVGPVPVATVRELWPDAVVKAVITRGVDVANVTSLGRRATAAMETAMALSMPRCTNSACDNDRFVEADHRLGWANVRRTRLDELDALCRACHRLKTNENWQLVAGAGRRRLVPPEHPRHPQNPPTPRWRG